MEKAKIKNVVKEGYRKIAKQKNSCCSSPCCGSDISKEKISKRIGYGEEEINSVPEGSNLGLGCGNPVALASLKTGDTVLDLGSGAGFDCFLAAKKVGKNGKVIGVDMTPEMIEKANENARKGNYKNVEFKLAEIEKLPVCDNSVDVIISNCVINLSPEKSKVFNEAFRVLKSGGRLMIADIVLLKELPEEIKSSISAYIGCLSGAMMKDKYLKVIKNAGFKDVRIIDETTFPPELILSASDPIIKSILENMDNKIITGIINSVESIKVSGIK